MQVCQYAKYIKPNLFNQTCKTKSTKPILPNPIQRHKIYNEIKEQSNPSLSPAQPQLIMLYLYALFLRHQCFHLKAELIFLIRFFFQKIENGNDTLKMSRTTSSPPSKKKDSSWMYFIPRHAKRLFLSGNRDLDSKMSMQFIWTNSLNKGL